MAGNNLQKEEQRKREEEAVSSEDVKPGWSKETVQRWLEKRDIAYPDAKKKCW